jgi:Zn-finger protein
LITIHCNFFSCHFSKRALCSAGYGCPRLIINNNPNIASE